MSLNFEQTVTVQSSVVNCIVEVYEDLLWIQYEFTNGFYHNNKIYDIVGIGINDSDGEEVVKDWCENYYDKVGELRLGNYDLEDEGRPIFSDLTLGEVDTEVSKQIQEYLRKDLIKYSIYNQI